MQERQVNNMNRIENLVDLDKLNELKVSELKKLNKLLGKEVEELSLIHISGLAASCARQQKERSFRMKHRFFLFFI